MHSLFQRLGAHPILAEYYRGARQNGRVHGTTRVHEGRCMRDDLAHNATLITLYMDYHQVRLANALAHVKEYVDELYLKDAAMDKEILELRRILKSLVKERKRVKVESHNVQLLNAYKEYKRLRHEVELFDTLLLQ